MNVRFMNSGLLLLLMFVFGLAKAQVNPDCQCIDIGKSVGDVVRVSGVKYTITVVSEDINGCVYDDCDRGACFWHWKAVAENGFSIHKNVIEGCEKATVSTYEDLESYGKAQDFKLERLYPNPVIRGENVSLSIESDGGLLQLDLYSIDGQSVRHSWFFEDGRKSQQIEINSKDLPAGTYLVRLHSGDRSSVHRLLVQ